MTRKRHKISKICFHCRNEYFKNPRYDYAQWNTSKFCSNKCRGQDSELKERMRIVGSKPSIWNEEQRLQISLRQRGSKSHFWKGGITPVNKHLRTTAQYKNWRKSVFERDNYTCQICSIRSKNGTSVYLESHHVRSFALFPELRFELSNGRTLCKECHKKVGIQLRTAQKFLKERGYKVEREPICKENGYKVIKEM